MQTILPAIGLLATLCVALAAIRSVTACRRQRPSVWQLVAHTARVSTVECQQTIDHPVANGLERDDDVLSQYLSSTRRSSRLSRNGHCRRKRQKLDGSFLDLQVAWLFGT